MNFFEKMFRPKARQEPSHELPTGSRVIHSSDGGQLGFTAFNGNAYENDIFRGAVDAIARNVARLKPCHVIRGSDEYLQQSNRLNRVLQVSPNSYMTSYDLLYKLVTNYYLYNNAFAYFQKGPDGELEAIHPITPRRMEYGSGAAGELLCKFIFGDGKVFVAKSSDVLHMRRFFNTNDLVGENNNAILPILELAHTQNQGIVSSIKAPSNIRGILKFSQVLSPTKMKEEKELFKQDFLDVNNNGGVVVVDSKYDYIPIENKFTPIEKSQIEVVQDRIYEYLGITKEIVNSSYDEDIWSAFYEGVVEHLALQFSLIYTRLIFTDIEQEHGNEILFTSNRLQFSNNKTKVSMLKELLPMGLFSLDEGREVLNAQRMGGIDGMKRLQSLNYVDQKVVTDYQMRGKENDRDKKFNSAE